MKNCNVCGIKLNSKTLGLKNILSEKERNKLEKVRSKKGIVTVTNSI